MRSPVGIVHDVDAAPPAGVNLLSGIQHVALTSISLIFPVLLVREAGGTPDEAAAVVSFTLLALAIGTCLQTIRLGRIGSGFLCQPAPSVLYFMPSLYAARHGGMHLVFGMTIAAGLMEVLMGRVLRRMRALFPPEIAGLVVLLAGISTGIIGLRTLLANPQAAMLVPADVVIALVTLTAMVVLSVWGRGPLHMFAVLIGMGVGLAAVAYSRVAGFAAPGAGSAAPLPWVDLPGIGHLGWTFDPALLLPFAVASISAALKVVGNVTTCQKAGDAEWIRPDMRTISRGVLADGLGTVLAGVLGTAGINSSTSAIGLASASGVLSRRVGWSIIVILVGLALVPGLGRALYEMPRAVAGAALVFTSTFTVVNGLQIMTSRMLDVRRTLVIGMALVAGLAVEIYPALLSLLPAWSRDALGSSLVAGTVVALALNGCFRIGMRERSRIVVPQGAADHRTLDAFIEDWGGRWGARRDVIERARQNLSQAVDTLAGGGLVDGPLDIEAAFDEFRLDIRISWDGPELPLPATRPSADEIIDAEDGERRLAGYMLRRFADRVTQSRRDGRTTMVFHYDH